MVTSAADLGDLQTKPNQIMHIYPYMIYLWRTPKSAAEVTIAMSLVWHFKKGISCRGKYALFGLEVTQISCRGHHCIVLGVGFSKRYFM